MILTMNKYAFMVFHKDYADFLDRIRQLGVVHIREIRPAIEDAALQTIMAERKRINVMMRFLANINKNASAPLQLNPARRITEEEGLRWLASLEALQEQKAKLLAKSAAEEKDLDYLSVWGDFTYPNIRNLRKAGYEVSFFTCPTARFEPQWGVDYNAFLVNNFQSVSYFVTVTKLGSPIDIDAERARMPEHDAPELRDIHAKTLADIRAIDDRLAREAADVHTLDALDRRMLGSIIQYYGGGPVGLDTLAATINEEAVTLEDVYEPYLLQQGYLTRTPRGRCVTRKAYEHLGIDYVGQERLEL